MEWEEILDSPCDDSAAYCSWEEFIRLIAFEQGFLDAHTDIIYPVYGFDVRYFAEPTLVGFAYVPTVQYDSEGFYGLFFDYDDVTIFEEFVEYVYQFEEPKTWLSDTELLIYHNRAAVLDDSLQEEVKEFGLMEVVSAALRGQYDGHSSWATHPEDVEV
jgi:hypothetical protein|tara:strand:+ start:1711 stop:2187 length:477 start_codon:yes stop_codon:yes gene_type:complete